MNSKGSPYRSILCVLTTRTRAFWICMKTMCRLDDWSTSQALSTKVQLGHSSDLDLVNIILLTLIIVLCIHLPDRIVTCGVPTIRSSGDTGSLPPKPPHFPKFDHCHHLHSDRCHLLHQQTCLDQLMMLFACPTTLEVIPIYLIK